MAAPVTAARVLKLMLELRDSWSVRELSRVCSVHSSQNAPCAELVVKSAISDTPATSDHQAIPDLEALCVLLRRP